MNRVNPLYIGALLVMVLILSIYLLSSAKQSLKESKESFKQTQKIANEISGLKKAYADERTTTRDIKRVLANRVLRTASIKTEYKNSGVNISSNKMDKKALDFLMGKVLNSSYDIRKMKIKRLSSEIASLELEIRW
jgi:hypothetical protein